MSEMEDQVAQSSHSASAQQEIQEREQHMNDQLLFQANILQNVRDSVIVTDLQGTISYWNTGATQIFGYLPEEMLGKTPALLYPDINQQQLAADLQHILAGNDYVDVWKGRTKSGHIVWVDIKTTPLYDEQGNTIGFIGVSRDVTQSKLAQEQLQESENRFRTMADTSPVLIWMADPSKERTYFNKMWLDFTGRALEQEKGYGWAEGVHPDDYVSCVEQYVAAFDQHLPFTMEYRLSRFDGVYRWILDNGSPRFAPDGTFLGYIGSCVDITERKEFETRKDEFVALLSHELKTPITSLKGFTQILQRRFKEHDDGQTLHFLARMDKQLGKLGILINDLLEISKMQRETLPLHYEDFDLNGLIQEIVENLQATTLTHHIVVESTRNVFVHADRDRIGQVLINLLNNAIKYSHNADKVILRMTANQHAATVCIQDFGIGIAAVHQQSIFERFYHVPDPIEKTFPGLGIGLYISREIIQRHHGRIWVESQKGEGSAFSFTLPLSKAVETPFQNDRK
jgi:PAS domain S-box-containing protein